VSRSSPVGGLVELNSLSGLEVGHAWSVGYERNEGVIVSLFEYHPNTLGWCFFYHDTVMTKSMTQSLLCHGVTGFYHNR
jgi:hypothetical protein